MKKFLPVIILCLLVTVLFVGCGKKGNSDGKTTAASETEYTTPTEARSTVAEVPTTAQAVITTAAEHETTAAVKGNPTITLSSTDTLTVKAGQKITLPDVYVSDYDGRDLSGSLVAEDASEQGSIKGNELSASISGEHTIYYHVETADKRYAEAFLTVNVLPAHENTFDEKSAYFAENMAEFKEFRDGFERGNKSCLVKTLSESSYAAYLTAEDSAIEGNSLIIDIAKIGGYSALRFYAFGDYFNFGKQTTYTLTFSYKILEGNNNFDDVYVGLAWDGMDGINRKFIKSDAKTGEVYTFSTEFTSVAVPNGKNANFMIFKLNSTDKPLSIAIDNIIIETQELEQISTATPTKEQLCSADGFTWDFDKTFINCDDGAIVSLDTLPDEIKNAIKDNGSYKSKLLKITNEGGHICDGLGKDNIPYGKIMLLDIDYYAVNNDEFHIIMMGSDGVNTTQKYTDSTNGNFHSVHVEAFAASNWTSLNIYSRNNPDMEIYIGKITVRFADKADDGKTPNGYSIGFKFEQNSREFGETLERNGWVLSQYDGYDFGEHSADMGEAPTKFTLTGVKDTTIEWINVNRRMEYGYTYKITAKYYVVSFDSGNGAMLYNLDNSVFPFIGDGAYMSEGYHEETITWTATKDVTYLSFYVDGTNEYNGVIYVAGVEIELVK